MRQEGSMMGFSAKLKTTAAAFTLHGNPKDFVDQLFRKNKSTKHFKGIVLAQW